MGRAKRRSLLAIVGACACAVAGTALAANSGSFTDPPGDAFLAPDLTGIAIASDDAGVITIKVTIGSGAASAATGEVAFAVDADQNPDTGSIYYGTEFAMGLEGLKPTFFSVDSSGEFVEAPAPASFAASFVGNVATFVFKAGDVGMTATSGFNVVAIGAATAFVDTAPDIRTANYQLVAGGSAPLLGADARAPVDEAVRSIGTHGKKTELLYYAADGRAETADTLRVYRGKKLLKTIRVPFADTNPFFEYSSTWRVPKSVKGKLRFCVSSQDRAGNTSNVSCAPLTIK